MDEARRRQILRDLDDDLERRIAARTHRPEPEARPREPARTAAETKELHDHAWTNWANALIDAKLQGFASGETQLAIAKALADFAEDVGKVVARVRGEIAEAIAAAKAEVVDQMRGEMAAAIETARAEFSAAVRQEISAPLRELRREIESGAKPRALAAPAEPRPLLSVLPPMGEA
jgi:hypothetical protein